MNESQLSRLLSDYLEAPGQRTPPPLLDPGLVLAAQRLEALADLLPAPEAAFERRVWQRLQATEAKPARRPLLQGLRLRWLAPAAFLFLLVLFAFPGPRQALGDWVASFQVGEVQVSVVTEATSRPALAAARQRFDGLKEAADATGFELLQPGYLPPGYAVSSVEAVTFDELPVWMRPLYIEVRYQPADARPEIGYYAVLREFNTASTNQSRVSEIQLLSESVHSVQDLQLAQGAAGVLIEFEPAQGDDRVVIRELIWERDGLTFELWSQVLAPEEMVRIAESLQ